MTKKDNFDLDRFLDGQRFGYECALTEIKAGRKDNHWIWYVFPQLKGLGHSPNANYYGISGRDEAIAYLNHPILGERLREISGALLAVEGKTIQEIMPGIDSIKLKSSMTLFDVICPGDVFEDILVKHYNGERDALTLSLLSLS